MGNINRLKLALEKGAEIDKEGISALTIAARYANLQIFSSKIILTLSYQKWAL